MEMPWEQGAANDHDVALEGLRGVAILLVLLVHVQLPFRPAAIDYMVYNARVAGNEGVTLFFVLSGFLITGVLLDTRAEAHYFRNFYARRALRTLPLYYLAVAALLFVWPHISPFGTAPLAAFRREQWWFWLHGTNVLATIPGPWRTPYNSGHFWSLAVEEQFYLVWPFVVLACVSRRWLLRTAALCIGLAFVIRLVMATHGASERWLHGMPFTRMDTLAVGAALAVFAREPGGLAAHVPAARRIAVWAAVIFAGLFAAYMTRHWGRPLFFSVGYSASALACGALLILVSAGPLGGAFSHPVLRFFGKYSYGIYIIHAPLVAALDDFATTATVFPRAWGSSLPGQLVFFVGGVTASTVAAVVVWHLWERPWLSLKRFFPRVDPAVQPQYTLSPAGVAVVVPAEVVELVDALRSGRSGR
jgi:peptidoglycan/LPS O-acetylase OafA/YrhL